MVQQISRHLLPTYQQNNVNRGLPRKHNVSFIHNSQRLNRNMLAKVFQKRLEQNPY